MRSRVGIVIWQGYSWRKMETPIVLAQAVRVAPNPQHFHSPFRVFVPLFRAGGKAKEDNAIRCGAMRGAQAQSGVSLVFVLAAILLACCRCAFALDPSLDVNQYAHTAWKVRDGFAKGLIASVAQTQDGYLWLGTEFGLLRFDGVRNVPWQPPNNQHLPPGTIRSLLVSRDGTLWIGAKGLASWKNGKLTEYPELVDQFIYALLEDYEGTVWVGTAGIAGGKLCAIHSGSIHCYGDDGFFGQFVSALHEDSHGNLWAGVVNGLWRWKPGPPKFYPLPGEPEGIQAVGEDTDRSLLVGWKGGIYRFIDGKTQGYSLPGAVLRFGARRILRDRDGGLWILTLNQGLVHVHEGRTDVFTQSDGLSGDTAYSVVEDREGNIWVTSINGLDRFHNLSAATFTAKQGLSKDLVGSVLADRAGTLWFGTYGGLNRWEHGQITRYHIGAKLNDVPESLFQDDRGRVWVSTYRQFGYVENSRFNPISGVPGGGVLSIAQDRAGNLWLANENLGLFRFSPQGEVRRIPWAALGHKDHASVLAADPAQGGLWIGFFLGGIAYFADGQIRASYTAAEGLGAGRVSDFKFDDDGTLWISTEGGLSRLKNDHIATLTSKNGLPCDTVHWAVEDDDHSYWLYMACGLIRIVRSEMFTWAAAADKHQDRNVEVRVTPFDTSDGVKSLSSPGHFHPQVAKTPDGKLWFLPWDGVSVFDPRHLPFNKLPPPVHVEQITADRKTYDATLAGNGQMGLPPLIHELQIDYTALSLVVPEKVFFRYKLEGLDRDWQDAGNRRQAFYTNLSPGNYTFRVMACNNSGVWNEAGTFLYFSVAPAYYQTLWFRSLCVVLFLAMLTGLYRLRLRQLARQYSIRLEERVNERTRMARELHDTQLIGGLMRAAIEHAGAERGLLIVPRGDELQIEAEATRSGEDVTVHLQDGAHTAAALPESPVRSVMRTPETIILDDASSQNPFSADPYIVQHRARSLLCLPLMNQGKLIGLLYLENNLTPNVFTPDRVTVLKVLASQAAISLENMRLYSDLEDRETKIRRLVDANILGIFTWNLEGDIVGANEALLTMLQYSRDDLVSGGVRWTDVTPAKWRERDERALAELKATGTFQPFEKEYFRKDGSRVPVLIGGALFREGGNEGVAFVLDLSEQKRAEAEIRALKDQLYRENLALREEVDRASMFEEIVGTSKPLNAVLSRIAKVAPTESTVLITGETGTGKELIARAVHKRSRRSGCAFVSVNCAALAPTLISSELFGHEKGAFTGATQRRLGRFELADGGTIFLDEVGELLPDTQVALLRVLQEREFERVGGGQPIHVDVRVIAGTNRDLKAAIAKGTFRQDLFYRLNVFPIEVPPLRERKTDLLMLVEYFVRRYASRAGKTIRSIDKKTLDLLLSYDWPGNIRELQNVIERSVILSADDVFSIDEL